MTSEQIADDDEGRVIGIAPATPGWWIEYQADDATVDRAPICAWVVREHTLRDIAGEFVRRITRVDGVAPTGPDWTGATCLEGYRAFDYEYVFDPDYRQPSKWTKVRDSV